MYNDMMNAILFNQEQSENYYQNMMNRFTPGYIETQKSFIDYYNTCMGAGGAKYPVTELNFSQGKLAQTKSPTDLAVNGKGFFVVSADEKQCFYSRNGHFTFKDGILTHPSGLKVMGYKLDESGNITGSLAPINLSLDPESKLYGGQFTSFHFDETGKLYGESTEINPVTKQAITASVPVYQVAIASFANPSGLAQAGTTLLKDTENSGPPVNGVPGQGILGKVSPSHLEMSNVDYIRQAYMAGQARQASSSGFAVIKAQDEINKMAVNLIK